MYIYLTSWVILHNFLNFGVGESESGLRETDPHILCLFQQLLRPDESPLHEVPGQEVVQLIGLFLSLCLLLSEGEAGGDGAESQS